MLSRVRISATRSVTVAGTWAGACDNSTSACRYRFGVFRLQGGRTGRRGWPPLRPRNLAFCLSSGSATPARHLASSVIAWIAVSVRRPTSGGRGRECRLSGRGHRCESKCGPKRGLVAHGGASRCSGQACGQVRHLVFGAGWRSACHGATLSVNENTLVYRLSRQT